MNVRIARRLGVGAVAALALSTATPAFAYEIGPHSYGGELRFWTEGSRSIMNIKDTGSSHWVKAEYYRVAHSGTKLNLWNKGGPDGPSDNDGNKGTVESSRASEIFKARGTVSRNNLPDWHTNWYSN
ncbi:conserved exported protein of unknown function [Streptomyces ambofaciens ATCC 23877]|uniref:Secreted protein n=1 Tax=Streptomyces ambofaciens (strain ATCC 23877 / 3486 / DSM 40053 / JCM 4204 / NBRC 12836 / NRRL B-2516) TaxID=278992 RepID=A0A0K2AVR4_STRA7|nr:hypothetical protein [Streptomyces ambofaciens]AKZ56996.1 conserved exported protein of unknown function [Streptomyces ambofaciens ATCC 23877]